MMKSNNNYQELNAVSVENKQKSKLGQWFTDFSALVKLRLSLTVVFSSVMAYLIALQKSPTLVEIVVLVAGGFFVTAAANIFNQVLEKDFDKLMKRTAKRPLVTGNWETSDAVLIAGLLSLFGITFLALFNPGTALLGTIALVSYAFMYTPMKRVSQAAVTVGAVAGALPTLIGCVAAEGRVSWLGLTLFGIQFFWQYTHFWSIAWLSFSDYKKAGYQFIPMQAGNISRTVGVQALIFALLLIAMSFVPFYLNHTGIFSLVGVSLLSVAFAYFAWGFYKEFSRKSALKLMFSSFFYIPLVLILFFVDKL